MIGMHPHGLLPVGAILNGRAAGVHAVVLSVCPVRMSMDSKQRAHHLLFHMYARTRPRRIPGHVWTDSWMRHSVFFAPPCKHCIADDRVLTPASSTVVVEAALVELLLHSKTTR